jgi:hypothetical protein
MSLKIRAVVDRFQALALVWRLEEVVRSILQRLAGYFPQGDILYCRSALHSIDKEGTVLVVGLDELVGSTDGMPLLQQLVLADRWRL